jgi:hypothetical protein
MKIKSAKSFRTWYKNEIKEIDQNDQIHNENFVGTYHKENGKKTIKGFFEMYHGDKPDIASYLPSILKIAEDGQAIYEFLQNAVDCGSTHFYIFYNESYFLAINNGSPFDIEGLQSILNIAQTTKKDPDKIGRFGIGFKLAHRLVGKNEGTEELVRQYKGPILFSWSKLEDLESLMNNEPIEPITPQKGVNNGFFDAPFLLKLLLTNFPSDPNETVKDLNYKDKILFTKEELTELIAFLNENFKIHTKTLNKSELTQGSLFFIKLGEDKKKLLDKDYSELVNGIQYSMNTLNKLEKVYLNDEKIEKIKLELEVGIIKKESPEFRRISPEYQEFDIRFAIGFNNIQFGNKNSYEQIQLLKEKPNFYKYFPMGDEINGFGFIIHCDSFSNEANRRKLHEDDVNRNLFPELAKFITQKLDEYKTKDRNKFLNLYASLLLSDIPERQNNKWLKSVFYDTLLEYIQTNIPTSDEIVDEAKNVKIKDFDFDITLSDLGLNNIHWFYWKKKEDLYLLNEAATNDKIGIEEWTLRDVFINADLNCLNDWIKRLDEKEYHNFLKELDKEYFSKDAIDRLLETKLFRFSDGGFYSINEVVENDDLVFLSSKIINIRTELKSLNFSISNLDISTFSFYEKVSSKLKSDEELYYTISEKVSCKNELTVNQKQNLFRNFISPSTKFVGIADETLKKLELFCDNQGNIKPLSHLVSSSFNTSYWLNPYKIRSDEYFVQLNSYLIQEDDLFDKIILKNIEIIKDELTESKEIKELVTFFKNKPRPFFNEYIIQKQNNGYEIINKSDKFQIIPPKDERKTFIDFIETYLSEELIVLPYDFLDFNEEDGILKGEKLHSQILKIIDIDEHKETIVDFIHYNEPKHKFLQEISEFKFNSKKLYEKEDYEFKILDFACSILNEVDYQKFKEKIIIETENQELTLSEIPPFTDKIKINGFEISLAKILPNNYENSDHLSGLIDQFIALGLGKERIENLFGVSEEAEPCDIFQMFSEQVETLENAEQLAFLLLYNEWEEEIDLTAFNVLAKDGVEYNLTYNYYTKSFAFLPNDVILDDRYNGIKKILNELPFVITDNNQLLEEPYFENEKFVCPDLISENLTDEQKLSLIDYLFNKWDKKDKKTVLRNIDWSKIYDKETESILGFNPNKSVFPSKYACESEVLPHYMIKWIGKDENRIDFISDLGVWTGISVIVELRKYLSDEINEFQNNRLSQEIRFNKDETNLFNSFDWLKENEIKIKSVEQFETFKKVVKIINENRTDYGDLEIIEDFDFEELKESSLEWNELFYEDWKQNADVAIFLYNGDLPKSISLDEIEDYKFYSFYEGNIAVDDQNNIYINQNTEVKKEILKLELDINNEINFDGLWQSRMEILEKENAQLKQLNGNIYGANFDEEDEDDAEFRQIHKEGYTRVKAHWRSLPNRNEINFNEYWLNKLTSDLQSYNNLTVGTNYSSDISKNDQKEANREAKVIVKEKLETVGFEFTNGIEEFSTINGVIKEGIEYPLVVKSYKNQDEPLKIGANEWIQLMRPNSMFWVYFGNDKIACLKLNELLRKQDNLTISFSTENLDVENRLEKFAELLRYFGDVHFDFHSIKPNNYSTATVMGSYQFTERKTEEDLSSDHQELL